MNILTDIDILIHLISSIVKGLTQWLIAFDSYIGDHEVDERRINVYTSRLQFGDENFGIIRMP